VPITSKSRKLPFKGNLTGKTETRKWVWKPDGTRGEEINPPGTITFETLAGDWSGIQYTESESHPVSLIKKRNNTQDIGGPFFTTRTYVETPVSSGSLLVHKSPQVGEVSEINHDFVAVPYLPMVNGKLPFLEASYSSDDELDEFGATAIARCEPTKSPVNLATTLGELFKDGLPSMIGSQAWKSRAKASKDAGSEYLNYQFGWMPLVGDVRKFANTVVQFDTVLAQYERDANKPVRRRYEFPTERTITETQIGTTNGRRAVTAPLNSDLYGSPLGTVTRTDETVRRRWFSGAFVYHLPTGYDSRSKVEKLALIADRLGITPTPDTLWELAPWSWAADWFTNAGDVIHNTSAFAFGGLVMRYGYVMEHTVQKRRYSITSSGLKTPKNISDLVLVTETKIRREANPFGFGVTWDGLSPFQASIAAALGLSRKR